MADINLSLRADGLHQQAIVIDAHCDILMPVADGITRLGASQPPHTDIFGCAGFYSLPQWQQGGMTAQVCAIYLEDKHLDRSLQRGLEMTWWLHQEVAENPALALVTQVEHIQQAKQAGRVGTILALEGLEPLGPDLRFLDLYYKLGLRMACLTHNRRNLYGDGPVPGVKTGGLSLLGRQAVQRMDELGIVVDLAHTNEPCFWEILELAQAPVIVSHLSPYLFARWRGEPWGAKPFQRELDREPLERIAKTNGVLGMIFYGQESLEQLVENIEILLDLVGPEHVGLGSDFYGQENTPKGLEEISQLPRLTEALVQRGHSDETILKILGGNFLRLFGEVWNA